jgi:hypothetical protein
LPNLFKSKTPKWAAVLGGEGFSVFRQMLLEASHGKIDADRADKAGSHSKDGHSAHLANLAEVCSRLERVEWRDEIDRWAKVFATGQDRPDPVYPRDMHMLKLQLYPETYFTQVGADTKNMLINEDIPGALTTIVVDWPDMVIVLQDDDPKAQWVKHRREVFAKLLDRLAQEQPYEVKFMEAGKGKEDVIAVIEGSEITAATHALVLDKLYPQLLGSNGALVGVPIRNMVIVKRLDAPAKPEMIAQFAEMTKHMASQTNYFISEHVYHSRGNAFTQVS